MLLAEIHGKRFPEIESQEDLLTSAVFGNLRCVQPGWFWWGLFGRAYSYGNPQVSLQEILAERGANLSGYTRLETTFWKCFEGFGEPDLILKFSGTDIVPIIVVIEAKLYSSKSGVGENDQLARYLRLLDDPRAVPKTVPDEYRYLIYLTPAFAQDEIEESCRCCQDIPDANRRIFGLQWSDILEQAEVVSGTHTTEACDTPILCREVARFLRGRGLDIFRGFRSIDVAEIPRGFFHYSFFSVSPKFLEMNYLQGGKFFEY